MILGSYRDLLYEFSLYPRMEGYRLCRDGAIIWMPFDRLYNLYAIHKQSINNLGMQSIDCYTIFHNASAIDTLSAQSVLIEYRWEIDGVRLYSNL